MEAVFIVHHAYEQDGEEEVKLIGVYRTRESAEAAVERLKLQPGFCDYPHDFQITPYGLDEDHWTEGFVTITTVMVRNRSGEWFPLAASCRADGSYQLTSYYGELDETEFAHHDIVCCTEQDGNLWVVGKVTP